MKMATLKFDSLISWIGANWVWLRRLTVAWEKRRFRTSTMWHVCALLNDTKQNKNGTASWPLCAWSTGGTPFLYVKIWHRSHLLVQDGPFFSRDGFVLRVWHPLTVFCEYFKDLLSSPLIDPRANVPSSRSQMNSDFGFLHPVVPSFHIRETDSVGPKGRTCSTRIPVGN